MKNESSAPKNNEKQQQKMHEKKEMRRGKKTRRLELIMANGKLCKHTTYGTTQHLCEQFSFFLLLLLLFLLPHSVPLSLFSLHRLFSHRLFQVFYSDALSCNKNKIPLRMKYVYLQYEMRTGEIYKKKQQQRPTTTYKTHVQNTFNKQNKQKKRKKKRKKICENKESHEYLYSCMRW